MAGGGVALRASFEMAGRAGAVSVRAGGMGEVATVARGAEATVRVGPCDAEGAGVSVLAATGAEDAATTNMGAAEALAVGAGAAGALWAGAMVRIGASIIGAAAAGAALSTGRGTANHPTPPATVAATTIALTTQRPRRVDRDAAVWVGMALAAGGGSDVPLAVIAARGIRRNE